MLRPILLVSAFCTAQAVAQDMHAMPMDSKGNGARAQILVTINPKARVTAVLSTTAVPVGRCGEPVALAAEVINQGFVTAPLRVRLVDPPAGVALRAKLRPLSGSRDELEVFYLKTDRKDPTDLTVAFGFTNDRGDLADRDHIHFILRCH